MLKNLAEEVVNYRLGPVPPPAEATSYIRGELGLEAGPAALRRIYLIIEIWCSYLVGAILGSYLHGRWQLVCFLVPVVILAAAVAIEIRWPIETRTAEATGSSSCGAET